MEVSREEITVLSNTQIKKLGERIREQECKKENCTSEDLIHLQNFRLSFKDSLNEIFQVLSEESKKVHKNRIISFRMKKIDTIFSKLKRESGMDLERMGDIAGCRCIVQSESAIYRIVERLMKNYDLKINDKIAIPDDDGYSALHIYVKSKFCKLNRTVEIQLRTVEQHNWSTLVEIIDVVFDTNIKTGDQSMPELNKFLKLYSEKEILKTDDKIELIRIESKYKIYNQLNETFSSNLVHLRMKWDELKDYTNNAYILFDVDQDTKQASFYVFNNYEEAEQNYFDKFRNSNGDLLVAHLNIANFKQLAAAYSNYVLTNHDFQDSWLEFCTITAEILIDSFDLENLFATTNSINKMLQNLDDVIYNDIDVIDKQFQSKKINVNQFLKLNDWLEEREDAQEERINKFNKISDELENKIGKMMERSKNPFVSVIRFLQSFLPKNKFRW